MKSFSFAKALTLGTLICMTLPVACGDDDDSSTPVTPSAGAGGEGPTTEGGAGGMAPAMLPPGISSTSTTKMCGADDCTSAKVGPVYVDPCCDATDTCGLNTGFLSLVGATFKDVCQAHDQAGDPDDTCPEASGLVVPFEMGGQQVMVAIDAFPGCCRPNGTCGVVVDKIATKGLALADFSLGCVDAAPFMKGKVNTCGASGGTGGAGGAGGAAPTSSGGAPGGAGGAGGAG